jgi:prepilin-type N-terminal cleavage/methylation domain-containing protein
MDESYEKTGSDCSAKPSGFTLIEILAVTTIALIVLLMGAGAVGNARKYSIEERAIIQLRQVADLEERYRFSSDPSVNPDGTYATFEELVLAGFIPEDIEEDDVRAHTVNAFLPYYRLDITRSPTNSVDEPDANQYYIIAYPIPTRFNLKTFHMIEDGEVWHSYGLRYFER